MLWYGFNCIIYGEYKIENTVYFVELLYDTNEEVSRLMSVRTTEPMEPKCEKEISNKFGRLSGTIDEVNAKLIERGLNIQDVMYLDTDRFLPVIENNITNEGKYELFLDHATSHTAFFTGHKKGAILKAKNNESMDIDFTVLVTLCCNNDDECSDNKIVISLFNEDNVEDISKLVISHLCHLNELYGGYEDSDDNEYKSIYSCIFDLNGILEDDNTIDVIRITNSGTTVVGLAV